MMPPQEAFVGLRNRSKITSQLEALNLLEWDVVCLKGSRPIPPHVVSVCGLAARKVYVCA